MANGRKVNQKSSTVSGLLSVGTVISLVVMLVCASICASLILAGTIAEASTKYCAIAIWVLSAIAGAAMSVGKRGEKRLYISLAVGVIYLLVLLSLTAVFFGGQYQGVPLTATLILCGCVLAVLVTQNRGMIPESRRSKNRRR